MVQFKKVEHWFSLWLDVDYAASHYLKQYLQISVSQFITDDLSHLGHILF